MHGRADRWSVSKGGDPLIFGRGAEEASSPAGRGHSFRDRPGRDGRGRRHRLCRDSRDPSELGLGRRLRDRSYRSRNRPEPGPARLGGPGPVPGYARGLHGSDAPGGDLPHPDPRGKARRDAGRDHRVGDPCRPANARRRRWRPSPRSPARADVRPPALLVVGEVVALRDQLDWYERLPLFGQRIVVTRPASEASRAAAVLEALGAEVILAPTVEVRPITDPGPLDAAIDGLDEFDWLVFTSSNGVRFFMSGWKRRAETSGRSATFRSPPSDRPRRKPWRSSTSAPTSSRTSYRSESLAAALAQAAKGRKILLARADRGRTVLKDELQHVADVTQVAVYHNADAESLPESRRGRILDGTVDWITVTSSAIVSRLHALLPEPARQRIGREVRLASLSPVTSETASRLGWHVAVEATEYTWEGLVHSLVERIAAERQQLRTRT